MSRAGISQRVVGGYDVIEDRRLRDIRASVANRDTCTEI